MAKIGKRPASPKHFELYLDRLRGYLDGTPVLREGHPSRIEWLEGLDVSPVPIEVAATGPKVIDIAARRADRICFAVGADPDRLTGCIDRARRSAMEAGRDPQTLRLGAYLNCVIHPDREVAREAIRGGLSVFAHFSGFPGNGNRIPARRSPGLPRSTCVRTMTWITTGPRQEPTLRPWRPTLSIALGSRVRPMRRCSGFKRSRRPGLTLCGSFRVLATCLQRLPGLRFKRSPKSPRDCRASDWACGAAGVGPTGGERQRSLAGD